MIDTQTAIMGLKLIAEMSQEVRSIIEELGLMPNIKFPTMGGKVWWNDLHEHKGWRIQRNSLTGHCRIIDPENVRHAWGTEDKINEFFEKLSKIPK